MAFCTSCGHEISEAAVACPNCGQPTGVRAQASGEYADFWSRFAGALIDSIILIPLGFVGPRYLGGFVVGFLYHWLLVAYWDGQTVGKKLLGIKITRPDGTQVDPGAAAARSAMRIVSGLALAIGFLWMLWDAERRTWHDIVADTRAFRVTR